MNGRRSVLSVSSKECEIFKVTSFFTFDVISRRVSKKIFECMALFASLAIPNLPRHLKAPSFGSQNKPIVARFLKLACRFFGDEFATLAFRH